MARRWRFCFATIALMAALAMPVRSFAASEEAPASCPVTLPSEPAFTPPGPYPQSPPGAPHTFWYGAAGLWTMLNSNGTHTGLASHSKEQPGVVRLRNKSFWWSPGFRPSGPPEALKIEGRRLDTEAPPLAQPWVTNARSEEFGGWTMLTMLELPMGCWEVTGSYGADHVKFVVWVDDAKPVR